jgi:dual specificity protein kinase YAK1
MYSDDLLLEEDSADESSLANAFSRGMQLGSTDASSYSRRFNSNASTSSSNPTTQR